MFLIHDAEEVATVERWLAVHGTELPAAARPLLGITTREFATSVVIVFLGFLVAAAHGVSRARAGALSPLFALAAGALVANAITHLAQAAIFRGYVPGVLSGALVVLPYGAALGSRLRASSLASRHTLVVAVAAGALAQLPIVLLALVAGRS